MNIPEYLKKVVRLQEITTDDVIKADIVKRLMWKRATLLSVGEKVVPIRNLNVLDEKWYIPDLEEAAGEFPVPEGAVAARSKPVTWIETGITMQMAEYRFMITDFAKARGQDNWQMDAQTRAGSEWFAKCIDQQILDALYAGAGATTVTVPSGAEWDSGTADVDPEGDIIKAWSNILAESNVGLEEIRNVCIIYPAKVDSILRGLKMIGNIQQSLQDYLKGSFGFQFFPTRYYHETEAKGIQDDALVVVKSEETAVHVKYTGAAIPMSETQRIAGRGTEYIVRQIFGTKVVPQSATVATSKRICKIANVI